VGVECIDGSDAFMCRPAWHRALAEHQDRDIGGSCIVVESFGTSKHNVKYI
jgi:hypothetical protein